MYRRFCPLILFASMLAAACGNGSPTHPTPTTGPVNVNLTAPTVGDSCKPPSTAVVFDANAGKATITNASPCVNQFLYAVWSVSPTDETNQVLLASIGATLQPGETQVFTLNFEQRCDLKLQRDVYIGVSDWSRTYSQDELNNYFWAALGVFQYTEKCSEPPSTPTTPTIPPPPVDVCPNLEGLQTSVPQGYIFLDGVCLLIPPPPITCGQFTFSGPDTSNVPNGAPSRLAFIRSHGAAWSTVVEVHPSHGGTFAGNNQTGFTFTPSVNYAAITFHHTGGRGNQSSDVTYYGVTAGVPLSVPSNGGDIFYFNCPVVD